MLQPIQAYRNVSFSSKGSRGIGSSSARRQGLPDFVSRSRRFEGKCRTGPMTQQPVKPHMKEKASTMNTNLGDVRDSNGASWSIHHNSGCVGGGSGGGVVGGQQGSGGGKLVGGGCNGCGVGTAGRGIGTGGGGDGCNGGGVGTGGRSIGTGGGGDAAGGGNIGDMIGGGGNCKSPRTPSVMKP